MENITKQIVQKPTVCISSQVGNLVAEETWEQAKIHAHRQLMELLDEEFTFLKCKVGESIRIIILPKITNLAEMAWKVSSKKTP